MSYILTEEGRGHMEALENVSSENLEEYGVIPLLYRGKLAILWEVEDKGEIPRDNPYRELDYVNPGSSRGMFKHVVYSMYRKGYIEKI